MANFPSSPSAGHRVTLGSTVYEYTGVAWKAKGSVPSSPAWSSSPEEASLDGVAAFKEQSASPSATADYAKIYTKDMITPVTEPEALFHLNGNVQDSSTNVNHGTVGATATPITYATTSGAGSQFSQAGIFDGSLATTGGDSYFKFDDIDIGTGDFTCSFWVRFDNTANKGIISQYTNGWQNRAFAVYRTNSNALMRIYYWDSSATNHDMPFESGKVPVNGNWYHFAAVRSGTTYSYYWGDPDAGATGKRLAQVTATAYHIGGNGDDWVVGNNRNSTGSANNPSYNFTGQLDEILIVKEALYSLSTYDIPTTPYRTSTGKLFAMDSLGNETQLTP